MCPGPYAGYSHKLKVMREYIIKFQIHLVPHSYEFEVDVSHKHILAVPITIKLVVVVGGNEGVILRVPIILIPWKYLLQLIKFVLRRKE